MRAALAGEPVRVRNPNSIRPWQHVLEPAQRLPGACAGAVAQPRSCARAGTSVRPTRTRGRSAGSCERLGELLAREAALGARRRAASARGALPEARLLAGAPAARLAAAGPRHRGRRCRRHRGRGTRALSDGQDMARLSRSGRSRPSDTLPAASMSQTVCRFCAPAARAVFADLGMSPLANSYLRARASQRDGALLSAAGAVCGSCFLVQLEEFETPEQIFSDYAYFSSYSSSWLEHCRRYAEQMVERLGLASAASSWRSPPTTATCCSSSTSARSRCWASSRRRTSPRSRSQKGIPTLVEFFGVETARALARGVRADLLLGNNVLAHVPDLNDFVGGHEDPAQAGRRDHDGVPASDAPDRGEPMGHDLPRALLLLLAS